MQIIKFTDTIGVPEEYRPVPASKVIPEWYKKLDSYMIGEKRPNDESMTTGTAKRCMPIFDAIASGYIIMTHTDLFISQKPHEDNKMIPFYQWANFGAIGFHSKHQLPEYPGGDGHDVAYPKWINTWAISTPSGYSCLFIPPVHRETPIIALPGVVDTDRYTAPVNFPFILRDTKMDGLIPAGTPLVQVIPFKREAWKMEIGTQEDFIQQSKITTKLRSVFFDSYKNQYRQLKEYL